MEHASRFSNARPARLSACPGRRSDYGNDCRLEAELKMGLFLYGIRHARHLDSKLCSRPASRTSILAHALLASARALGRWFTRKPCAARVDALGHLHGLRCAANTFRYARSPAL